MANINQTIYKTIKKIDLHAHCFPETYSSAIKKYFNNMNPDEFPFPEWQIRKHLDFMDENNIFYTLLSISSPHVNFDTREVNKVIIRESNEEMAEMIQLYPQKFGYMAVLPIPNVEDTINEIIYCDDFLKVKGFTLPTNTKGIYISDPQFIPVFEELNKRHAFVTFHPNRPDAVPQCAQELPFPIMEFFFDTTRVVADMILKNYINRFSNIKWLIPHAGALLPVIVERISSFSGQLQKMGKLDDTLDVWGQFNNLYFDCSGDCAGYQIDNLLKTVPVEHVVYGSDYPFSSIETIKNAGEKLYRKEDLDCIHKKKIFFENGSKFFINENYDSN